MTTKLVTFNRNSDCYYITISQDLIKNWKKTCNSSLIISLLSFFLKCLMEIELIEQFGLDKGEHDSNRKNSRNGYVSKTWHTLIGEITLPIPKLRHKSYHPFFQSSLDSLSKKRDKFAIFSYVCGITTRYIRPLFELVSIKPMDKSAVSRKSKNYLDKQVNKFRKRDLSGSHFPILCMDALYETVHINNICQKAAVIVITGINLLGERSILDVQVTTQECKETYLRILQDLKKRGLKNPDLIISDAHAGIKAAISELFPGSLWQRCAVHLIRETLKKVRFDYKLDFYIALRKIYDAENYKKSQIYLQELNNKFPTCKGALKIVNAGIKDTLTFLTFPGLDYHKIYSSNLHERLNRSIRKRTRISEQFPNQASYTRLVISWITFFTRSWINQPYLNREDMEYLHNQFLKKQERLENNLGKGSISKPTSTSGFKIIYLSTNNLKLSKDNTGIELILATGVSYSSKESILCFNLLTGLNDSEKINTFINGIKDWIGQDNYLIVQNRSIPLLNQIVIKSFKPEHIQYNINGFLPVLLSYIPTNYRDSVKENLNELISSSSYSQSKIIFDSLTNLWRDQVPKLTALFEELFPFFFRYLNLSEFNQNFYSTQRSAQRIPKSLISHISVNSKIDSKNLITGITNFVNSFNKGNFLKKRFQYTSQEKKETFPIKIKLPNLPL